MNPVSILSRYFGRQFLMWFCLLLSILLLIVLLIDTIELLRRAAGKPDVTLALVLRMGLFKLPGIGQKIVPFVVLFSSMFTFWRLNRSNELVVVRAAGVSVWQFLLPALLVALLVGVVRVGVVNPLGAAMVEEYDRLEEHYLKRRGGAFDVNPTGLWLRQGTETERFLIHAESVVPGKGELRRVTVFRLLEHDRYGGRLDAPVGQLKAGHWEFHEGWLREPSRPPQRIPLFQIPTELTQERLEDNFAPPETISFWDLPYFIHVMEATGFSAIRHRLYFQSLLAQPLLYCAMVLLAAAFSLRHSRRGGTLWLVSGGLFTGFSVFIATDVVLSMGASENIPVALAAWAPTLIALLIGTSALLHLEDG